MDAFTAKYLEIGFRSWKTAILLLLGGMAISFFLFGFWWPYWRIADQDLILAYQGLLFNDGLRQEYYDHTGYLTYLMLGEWYRLLHGIGLLPVHALHELPPATDVAAFNAAWQRLVVAGRILSLLTGILFVWTFAMLMRRLVGDWRIAALSAMALAYSGGVATLSRIIRTELLSGGFVITALLLVLLAASGKLARWRMVALAAAGALTALAVVAKVQAIFPALAIPVVALAFAEPGTDDAATSRSWLAAAVWGALGLAGALASCALIYRGINEVGSSVVNHVPIGHGISGAYQALFGGWIVALMAVHGWLAKVPLARVVAAMGAVAVGIAVGLSSLLIRYDIQNVIAVANPIEHMFAFALASDVSLGVDNQVLSGSLLTALANGIGMSLANHSFVFRTSHRPTLLLEWLALIGAFVAWRRGNRRLPFQVAVLVGAAWAQDAVFGLRGLKQTYFVYSDPFLIIAAALTALQFASLGHSLRVQRFLVGLFAFYVIWAHAEPLKSTLSRKQPTEDCYFLPVLVQQVKQWPFCPARVSNEGAGMGQDGESASPPRTSLN